MPMFRRKPGPDIYADQYLVGKNTPSGVKFDTMDDGKQIAYVTTIQGVNVPVHDGEWIVTERGGGRHYPISADEFERLYEWVPG